VLVLSDKGYQGSSWAKVPYKGKNKPAQQKEANRRVEIGSLADYLEDRPRIDPLMMSVGLRC
jgi:hypothetical protein